MNPYVYAENNPVDGRDPSGTCTLWHVIETTYYDDGSWERKTIGQFFDGECAQNGGGGGGSANPDVVRRPNRIMACSRSASTVMAALQHNFNDFASFSSRIAPALAFNAPTQLGVGTSIPIMMFAVVNGNTINYNTSVTVQSMSANSLTFVTVPGHSLYPGTITFSASNAGPSQIRFGIDIRGNFANVGWQAGYRLGGSAFENAVWNNLMNNVGTFCGSSR